MRASRGCLGSTTTRWVALEKDGSPQKLAAHGTLTADGVDAEAALLLGWAGGAYAQLETSLIAHSGNTARVVGTGRVVCRGPPHPLAAVTDDTLAVEIVSSSKDW